jgi:DNA repair protein SbcC/Rad50
MIAKIVIKNFQSHEDTELELDKGFNLIIGASDNGKSTILRAIEWVRTNKPKGNEFIQHDKKETLVKLVADGKEITRDRTISDTGRYIVNKTILTFMGGNVPEQVDSILNMKDINVQLQLDRHFLILDTPGQAASTLNSITKLDKIDEGLGKLRSKKREATTEIESISIKLQEVKNFLSLGIDEDLKKVKKLQVNIKINEVKKTNLSDKILKINQILNQLDLLRNELVKIPKVKKAINMLSKVETIKYQELNNEICELSDLIDNLENLKEKVKCSKIVKKSITDLGEIDIKGYQELNSNIGVLYDLISGITTINNIVKTRKDESVDYKLKIDDCLKQIKECPYCGSELIKETKEILLSRGNR